MGLSAGCCPSLQLLLPDAAAATTLCWRPAATPHSRLPRLHPHAADGRGSATPNGSIFVPRENPRRLFVRDPLPSTEAAGTVSASPAGALGATPGRPPLRTPGSGSGLRITPGRRGDGGAAEAGGGASGSGGGYVLAGERRGSACFRVFLSQPLLPGLRASKLELHTAAGSQWARESSPPAPPRPTLQKTGLGPRPAAAPTAS